MDNYFRKPGINKRAVASAVENILINTGHHNPHPMTRKGEEWEPISFREGLRETPARVAEMMEFLMSGYDQDPIEHVKMFEEQDGIQNQLIVVKNIEIYSMCEHHMMPFFGSAHIGYIPSTNKFIGSSKLIRIADVFARRLQIQERLTAQIANFLMKNISPEPVGVGCVIEAEHLCMRMRGVQKQNSIMITSALRGVFLQESSFGLAARNEFMSLIKR